MLEIRHLRASDADQLVACFRECYGDTYANENFHDPKIVERLVTSGELRSVVALSGAKLVGHTGLTVRHKGAKAAEAGNTVVPPSMRGQGLLGKLGRALRTRTLEEGFAGYVHYPTTAHEIMQKSATSGKGRETGIMLAYIPAETEYNDFEGAQGRLAATIVYQPLTETGQREIYLPARYADTIRSLPPTLGLVRCFAVPDNPENDRSVIKQTVHARRNLMQLLLVRIGSDLSTQLSALLDAGPDLVHVDINMADAGIGFAVDLLADLGFVYSGWLPDFYESDVLRMQRIANLTEQETTPNLVTNEAAEFLTLIKSEINHQSET